MPVLAIIYDYLLLGLKLLIPVLFILRFDKLKPQLLDMQTCVIAFNITLLFTAGLCIVDYIVVFFTAYYSGVEYLQYSFINKSIGPYWFSFWIPIFITVLMPQLVWIKKIRNSVAITYIWFGLSALLSFFVYITMVEVDMNRDYIKPNTNATWINYNYLPSLSNIAFSLTTALIVISVSYQILLKRGTAVKNT